MNRQDQRGQQPDAQQSYGWQHENERGQQGDYAGRGGRYSQGNYGRGGHDAQASQFSRDDESRQWGGHDQGRSGRHERFGGQSGSERPGFGEERGYGHWDRGQDQYRGYQETGPGPSASWSRARENQADWRRGQQQGLDRQQGYQESGTESWQADDLRRGGRAWDQNYRTWRQRQMEQFDREYEEYCRERQDEFDRSFDEWRSRRAQGQGSSGAATNTGGAQSTGTGSESSATPGAEASRAVGQSERK